MSNPPQPFSKVAEELIASLRRIPTREPRNMRKRPTQEAGALVESLMVKHRIGRPAPEDAIRERWVELVGAPIAAYSHAVTLEQGRKLIVNASHAVVRNELFLHRAEIVARIRKLPGCAGVQELWVKAG
jgi:hypothetical protein